MDFSAVESLLKLLTIIAIVFVPFGVWKMIELCLWVINHIQLIP